MLGENQMVIEGLKDIIDYYMSLSEEERKVMDEKIRVSELQAFLLKKEYVEFHF